MSSQEFNDETFVKSLPVRRGLEESPGFAIPKSIMRQLSEMIAEKKITLTKDVPPKLVGRIPFNLVDDAKEHPVKQSKETVFVDSEGNRTKCVGEECTAETEVRDPLSMFSEAAPYSLVGEQSISKDALYKEQLARRVTTLNLEAVVKLQSYLTSIIPQIVRSNPTMADADFKNIVRRKAIEKAKELGRDYPLTQASLDSVIDESVNFIFNYRAENPDILKYTEDSPRRESPARLS